MGEDGIKTAHYKVSIGQIGLHTDRRRVHISYFMESKLRGVWEYAFQNILKL